MSVEIDGTEQLSDLAKRLRVAGRKDLQKELGKALNRATKAPRAEIRRRAAETLPRRGGLAERVAKSRLSARRRGDGVRISDRGNLDLPAIDRGVVRHPVFGDRKTWVRQQVKPKFFTAPLEDAAPHIRRDVEAAMRVIAKQIES